MSDQLPPEKSTPQLPPPMPKEPPIAAPWWVLPAIGAAVLCIFAGGVVGVFIIGDGQNLTSMIQAIINATMLVLGFWFGSSSSGQKKDATIASMLNGKQDSPVAIAVSNPSPENQHR